MELEHSIKPVGKPAFTKQKISISFTVESEQELRNLKYEIEDGILRRSAIQDYILSVEMKRILDLVKNCITAL